MKKRILIVDDNEMMREFLAHLLGKEYEVVAMPSSEKAINYFETNEIPDLVLTDYSMGGRSGLELVRYIKSVPGLEQVPVIVVSSKAKSEDRINFLQAGAEDYLVKPFNPIELQLRVEKVLSKYDKTAHSNTTL